MFKEIWKKNPGDMHMKTLKVIYCLLVIISSTNGRANNLEPINCQSESACISFYYPPMKLPEGNVFTGVCLFMGVWLALIPCPFWGWVSLVPCPFQGGGGYVQGMGTHPPPRYMGPEILWETVDKQVIRILL